MGDIGDALRAARSELGLELGQAAADTRISRLFLEALEGEEFEKLPAAVYVRGFLRSYASYLGLDGQALIDLLPPDFSANPAAPQVGFVPGPKRGVTRDPWTAGSRGDSPRNVDPPTAARSPGEAGVETPAPFPGRRTVGRRLGGRENAPPAVLEALPPAAPILGPRGIVDRGEDGSPIAGLALLGLAALVALGIVGGLILIVSGGGDGTPSLVAGLETATAGSRSGTVVAAQGSPASTPTVRNPSGTISANAAASTTATATVGAATPSATASTPSPTPDPSPSPTPETPSPEPTSTPAEAATSTATPLPPAPTATQEPPTATPSPVVPTPTPSYISHPFTYDECQNGICGGLTWRVVCAPDGWFIDTGVNGTFPAESYGWPVRNVSQEEHATACSS